MLRKLLCASLVLIVCVAITKADEITGIVITKVDPDKKTITYKKRAKKGEEAPKEETTIKLDDKVSVVKGKFDKDTKKMVDGDAIEKGIKDDLFTKIDAEKGVGATITTSGTGTDALVTKIVVGGGRMKKMQQQQ